jgi:ubiquitin-protein ligase E3 C
MMDTDRPNEKLPTASTCFNILRLPSYTNSKVMKEKVLYAINSNAGFELV